MTTFRRNTKHAMKNSTTSWLRTLAYLLGALMFLIGAGRLPAHNDATGAIIFGLTFLLAVLSAAANHSHRLGKATGRSKRV
jgi:hypothetical protein